STPTHSYMKWLYKYPQREYPYARLIEQNRGRNGAGPEFELLDSGVFDEDRYFDIFVEYAKAAPEDLLVRLTAWNRGPDPAPLHVLPQLWFRNTWAWGDVPDPVPEIVVGPAGANFKSLLADDSKGVAPRNLPFTYRVGKRHLYMPEDGRLLFTDNETNGLKVYGPGAISRSAYAKDAFHRHVVNNEDATNPERIGTK